MNEHDVHLPSPSVWPVTLACGITLVGFGVLTSLALSALGAIMLAWALVGWIQELRHDR
jgi:Cytochrome c oxidase subunit IV